ATRRRKWRDFREGSNNGHAATARASPKSAREHTSSRRSIDLGNTGLGAALEDDCALAPGDLQSGGKGRTRLILVFAAKRQQALTAQAIDLRQIKADAG